MKEKNEKVIDGTLYPSERQARRWGLAKVKHGKIVKVPGGYKVIRETKKDK